MTCDSLCTESCVCDFDVAHPPPPGPQCDTLWSPLRLVSMRHDAAVRGNLATAPSLGCLCGCCDTWPPRGADDTMVRRGGAERRGLGLICGSADVGFVLCTGERLGGLIMAGGPFWSVFGFLSLNLNSNYGLGGRCRLAGVTEQRKSTIKAWW